MNAPKGSTNPPGPLAELATLAPTRRGTNALCFIALLAILSVVFAYSVRRRTPFIEQAIQADYRTKQTAHTLSFCQNWYEERAQEHRFILHSLPWSPATPTIESRDPYIRFPFGFAVPIYWLACLQKTPPTLRTVITWNLAVQATTVLLIALLVWSLLSRHRTQPWVKLISAAFAGSLYALSSLTMQGHTLDYHCTEGVIPWFVGTVLLEYLRLRTPSSSWCGRLVRWLLPLVVFLGCMTEWFMFIVVSVLLARRWWMRKEHEQGTWADHLALIIVPTIALGIVIWKVAEVGHFQILWLKFQQRTGLNPKLSGHPGNSILKDFYHRALGLENTALVWFSLCTLLVTEYRLRRQAEITVALRTAILDVIGLGYLLIIPCLLHAHILKEHYAIHGDNTLKFMVLVAIVPFSLVPLVMLLWLQARNLEWRLERPLLSTNLAQDFPRVSTSVLVTTVLLGTCFRLIPSHADWQGSFARDAQLIKTTDLTLPKLLQATAQGDELYFSPNIELGVDYDELFQLSISKKIVYRVQTVDEISQHPALQAAKTFGQSTHLRLIVDLTQPPHDWQTTDQPILGKELLHNDRFSIWEVQLPTP